MGITIANSIVLVTTIFAAYFTSPPASFTSIGNTAKIGTADCTIKVFLSISVKFPGIFKEAASSEGNVPFLHA